MNEQEIKEFFKQTFNTVADGYDSAAMRFFPESAAKLPGYLDLQGSEHVLDVATGTGAGAMALAVSLPYGRVTGIDFSKNMLTKARKKISALGVENTDLYEMDMQNISFPDRHFDAATCCFALFFIEDMQQQLVHIASKVREGGRVVITSFLEKSFSPPVDVFFSCLERYGIEPPIMSWKRVASVEKCKTLFENADLKNVLVDQVDSGYYLNSPEEWWQIVWNGGFRGLVEQLEKDAFIEFKKEHLTEIGELSNREGIKMELGIIYSRGVV